MENETTILQKINKQIEEIKISMNKKEDYLKDLINEKDNIIEELNYKINKHENLLKYYKNKIDNFNAIIKDIINRFDDKIIENETNIKKIYNSLYNQNIHINEIENCLNKEINNAFYGKNNNKDDLIKNFKYFSFDKSIFEINEKLENYAINERINKYGWINLTFNYTPKIILITNIRLFYYFFNNLLKNINNIIEPERNYIKNYIKYLYFNLLKTSLKGEMTNLLTENILKSEISILKLINSPKRFFKEKITIFEIDNDDREILYFISDFIEEIPKLINEMKVNVNSFEEYQRNEEERRLIEQIFEKIKCLIDDYNFTCDKLKEFDEKENALEIQIDPKILYKNENIKNKISKYMDCFKEDEIIITFWKIPFKNENISITYNNIPIYKGKNDYLYFRIDNLDDEFKQKFYVKKKLSKNKELIVNVNDYIYFNKAEKIIIKKLLLNIEEEELLNKIKSNYIKNWHYPKLLFKGKTFKEISSSIDKVKNDLSKIHDLLDEIIRANIEKRIIEQFLYLIRYYCDKIKYVIYDLNIEDNSKYNKFYYKIKDIIDYMNKKFT